MKKYLIITGILVVVTAFVWIQKPRILDNTDSQIVLKAPISCDIGELVELDAAGSDATSFTWQVIPDTPNFRIIENGRKLLFCSGSPGEYLFILAAAKRDTVDIYVHRIIVKGGTIVPPSNNFITMVEGWLPKNCSKTTLLKLSTSFERVAAAQHNDVESLVSVTAASNRAILNGDLEVWKPFLINFSNYLKTNLKDATVQDHVVIWFKFADALKEISKGN